MSFSLTFTYLMWSLGPEFLSWLLASECFFKKSMVFKSTVVLSIFLAALFPSGDPEVIMVDNSETRTLNWSRRFFSLWLRDLRLVSSRSSPKSSMMMFKLAISFFSMLSSKSGFFATATHWTTLCSAYSLVRQAAEDCLMRGRVIEVQEQAVTTAERSF